MSLAAAAPAVLAAAIVTAMGLRDWNLRNTAAVRIYAAALLAAAGAVALVAGANAAGFILGLGPVATALAWCGLGTHEPVAAAIGVPALAIVAWMTTRTSRIVTGHLRTVRAVRHEGPLAVITSDQRFAYAVPTGGGCVVVSSAMLASLAPRERQAMLAHERAHLRLHHHWYVLLAETCVAILPALRPLARQLRHATERAADEAAAVVVRDRRIVARAIASAALAGAPPTVPSIAGGSVARRVEALVFPERVRSAGPMVSAAVGAVVLTAALALSLQAHHVVGLAMHVCGLDG